MRDTFPKKDYDIRAPGGRPYCDRNPVGAAIGRPQESRHVPNLQRTDCHGLLRKPRNDTREGFRLAHIPGGQAIHSDLHNIIMVNYSIFRIIQF